MEHKTPLDSLPLIERLIGGLALDQERRPITFEFDELNNDDMIIKLEMLERIPKLKKLKGELDQYKNPGRGRDKLRAEKEAAGVEDLTVYIEGIREEFKKGHFPLIEHLSETQRLRDTGFSDVDMDKYKTGFSVKFNDKFRGWDEYSPAEARRLKEIERVNNLLDSRKDAAQQIDMGF